jgi:glycosyltransferase involved in cell wall biosynthesis
MLSIITPTYNRCHLLGAIYQSLLRQSNKDFVWIIIDDGSTDNTQDVCQAMIDEQKIKIVYERQENGGVNRARNRGVELAQGELITSIDSDDYFSDDAVETIYHYWQTIKDNPKIACICFLNGYQGTGKIVGTLFPNGDVSINNYTKLYYWDKVTGDKTGATKTEILRRFPFPVFEGEKFAPEEISFNRAAKEYDLLCVNKIIKYVEYLEEGITKTGYPESEIVTGLLTCNNEKIDKAFPYRVRSKSMKNWLWLKLQVNKTPLLSTIRESKSFWLCLVNLPRVWAKMLKYRVRKKLGINKAKKG